MYSLIIQIDLGNLCPRYIKKLSPLGKTVKSMSIKELKCIKKIKKSSIIAHKRLA
jgi:hypothetical protein